jgi:hypothetical protein
MVGQAIACHLPTIILADMKKNHHFYHHSSNRWFNEMILIADSDIYPELIGNQAWYGKICDTLA